jgi:Aspartyl protease
MASIPLCRLTLTAIVALSLFHASHAFVPSTHLSRTRLFATTSDTANDASQLMDIIRAMPIKALKQELQERQISTSDVFEKEQLVQRLYQARKQFNTADTASSSSTSSGSSDKSNTASYSSTIDKPLYLSVPMQLTAQQAQVRVSPDYMFIPDDQAYATLTVQVPGNSRPLKLLLDTASTGLVLRRNMAHVYNLTLAQMPGSMTGVMGGAQGNLQTTQLTIEINNRPLAPMPGILHDIAGLPPSLDGILGLSFTNEFYATRFMFDQGEFRFYKHKDDFAIQDDIIDSRNDIDNGDKKKKKGTIMVAQTPLTVTSNLGLLSVPVYFGTRGPVNMLFDSGSSTTVLNWKGVEQLGLSRNSPAIQPSTTRASVMGSDNVHLAMTHQLFVSSSIRFGKSPELPGIQLQGKRRLPIEIGPLPVLDQMPEVGGILGLDVLSQLPDMVFYSRPPYRLELYGEELGAQ